MVDNLLDILRRRENRGLSSPFRRLGFSIARILRRAAKDFERGAADASQLPLDDDLRTPHVGIVGVLARVRQDDGDEGRSESFRPIRRASDDRNTNIHTCIAYHNREQKLFKPRCD